MRLYDLTFCDTDLSALSHLLDSLYADNSGYYERLVYALSRIGIRVTVEHSLGVSLCPATEVLKNKVVQILQGVVNNGQKKQDHAAR